MIKKLWYFLHETLKDVWGFVLSPVEGVKRLYQASLYRNAAFLILTAVARGVLQSVCSH